MWPTTGLTGDRRTGYDQAERTTTVERVLKLTLILGFGALFGALLVAHISPASGYELSVYRSTPVLFWGLWALAAVGSLAVSVYSPRSRYGLYGLLLGGLAAFAVPALPLLRGYYFLGVNDSLTHLGIARALAVDGVGVTTLVYPAAHTVATFLSALSGVGLPHSMMRTVLAFVALYFVGVPLTVAAIIDDQRALLIAGFSAFLLLPVNTISTYLHFHPFSLATFFFPLVLYVTVAYLTGESERIAGLVPVSGLLLLIVGGGFILVHPQASLNYLILLVAVVAIQTVAGRLYDGGPIVESNRVYGYTAVLAALFLLWSSQHWQFFVTGEQTARALLDTLAGRAQPGEVVTRQTAGDKAQQVGFTVPELFAKVFLVEALYCLLAAGAVGQYLLARRSDTAGWNDHRGSVITYLGIGGVALLPFFLLQFLGAVSSYFFRHIGFGMVLITVLASVGVYSMLATGRGLPARGLLRPAAVVVCALLLILSMSTVFGSPYMFKYTQHADEQQMQGWETSFAEQHPSADPDRDLGGEVWYGTSRTPFTRYKTAMAYAPGTPWYPDVVTPFPKTSGPVNSTEINGGLVTYYQTFPEEGVRRDHYFVVSSMAYQRETISFNEFRYSRETYRGIERQPNVHRVHSNGGMTVYYVDLPGFDPSEGR